MTIPELFTTPPDASAARPVAPPAAATGDILAVPREAPADSFVLHAPLELVARAALLPFVAPAQRDRARDQITAIATEFEGFGPPLAAPAADGYDSVPDAAVRLVAAINHGDLNEVDHVARWLGRA